MKFNPLCKWPVEARLLQIKSLFPAMRLTAVFLFVACLQVVARGNEQTVTLSMRGVPVTVILKSIEKQTGYIFDYAENELDEIGLIDIEVENASLQEALDICFNTEIFVYKVYDKHVVIRKKGSAKFNNSTLPTPEDVKKMKLVVITVGIWELLVKKLIKKLIKIIKELAKKIKIKLTIELNF